MERIDTIGAWIVHRFAKAHGAAIEGLSPEGANLLEQVAASDQTVAVRPHYVSPLTRVLGGIKYGYHGDAG